MSLHWNGVVSGKACRSKDAFGFMPAGVKRSPSARQRQAESVCQGWISVPDVGPSGKDNKLIRRKKIPSSIGRSCATFLPMCFYCVFFAAL